MFQLVVLSVKIIAQFKSLNSSEYMEQNEPPLLVQPPLLERERAGGAELK